MQKRDAYTWAVLHIDGSYIGEYDRPEGCGFAEVDGTQVKQLKLESSDPQLHSHYVEVPAGATPVFFRRRSVEINPLRDANYSNRPTAHCIGWKQNDRAVYLFVLDDGSTLLTDDLQAV